MDFASDCAQVFDCIDGAVDLLLFRFMRQDNQIGLGLALTGFFLQHGID
jgi:hypothetical protein